MIATMRLSPARAYVLAFVTAAVVLFMQILVHRPVLSVAFSMTWGMGALLLSAIPVYLMAALALPAGLGQPVPAAAEALASSQP